MKNLTMITTRNEIVQSIQLVESTGFKWCNLDSLISFYIISYIIIGQRFVFCIFGIRVHQRTHIYYGLKFIGSIILSRLFGVPAWKYFLVEWLLIIFHILFIKGISLQKSTAIAFKANPFLHFVFNPLLHFVFNPLLHFCTLCTR